ncbi:MAG: stage V sporulation protein AD [Oscillospiraceae bacterium]
MASRIGRYTLNLESRPSIIGNAAVVGKTESEGPLCNEFDYAFDDDTLGESSFEKAESSLQREAITRALDKAGKTPKEVDYIFAGDLLNQCIGTSFSIREMGIPFLGLYGACSTMALSLGLASVFVDTNAANLAVAATSSHFCSAERQFRLPLEYGGQRTPTSQRTATASGCSVVSKSQSDKPCVEAVCFGRIVDLGIKDTNNMGAAMAPAAAMTISDFLNDTNSKPDDYDLIVTGDLGLVGSQLLKDLLVKDYNFDISNVHTDCGVLIYDIEAQDVHAGASGCGCGASVFNSYILRRLSSGELSKVLFVATGALMSPTSSLQGESIPAIAHAVLIAKPECPLQNQ